MAELGDKYYEISLDGVDAQYFSNRRRFKVGAVFVGGSFLMLLSHRVSTSSSGALFRRSHQVAESSSLALAVANSKRAAVPLAPKIFSSSLVRPLGLGAQVWPPMSFSSAFSGLSSSGLVLSQGPRFGLRAQSTMLGSEPVATSENPLVQQASMSPPPSFPAYADIKPEHVVPAMNLLITQAYTELDSIEAELEGLLSQGEVTYALLAEKTEAESAGLSQAWSTVQHLKMVCDSDPLRAAVEEVQPKVVEYSTRRGQSKPVFNAWKFVLEGYKLGKQPLNPAQLRIVEHEVQQGKLSGVDLEGEAKERFTVISKRQAELGTVFGNNLLDSAKAFTMDLTTKAQVAGLPESWRQQAANRAKTRPENPIADATPEDGPWAVSLDVPTYLPIMQYADDRNLRETMYKAYLTRASEYTQIPNDPSKTVDNAPVLAEILKLRQEKAEILGYQDYAEVSMASKMATLDSANDLLEDLRKTSFEVGKKELADLQSFAVDECGFTGGKLQQWDVTYYAEKLKEAKYKFNEEELKPYFSLPKALNGLWALVHRLFSIVVEEVSPERQKELGVSLWHEDVKFYQISDLSGNLISYFFFDFYSRPGTKQGGAWMNDVVGRTTNKYLVPAGSEVRLPVALMVCNQAPPVADTPSLMTFREVETLFHEFGHALQHMLTKEPEGMAAGINLVEWDAVEQPSQFMENWCYDKATIDKMAFHYQTGEPIPEELFNKLLAAKNFRAASMMLRQVHFSLLDLSLHTASKFDPAGADMSAFDLDRKIGETTEVMAAQPYDRFLCSFSHIFAGGYAAGYYSYKWAEILSADDFGAFEDAGLDNEEAVRRTGARFRDTVLGLGGGRDPAEVFRDFRGRDPTPEALLRQTGLLSTAKGAAQVAEQVPVVAPR